MKEAVIRRRAHPALVGQMLSQALCLIAGSERVGEAWRHWLSDDDLILAKFNRSGADSIRTTEVMCRTVVSSLGEADIAPDQIMLLEAPGHLAGELGTRQPPAGWSDKEYDFGSGRDQFRAALEEATAVINVPFLKTHNLAGMTGCLKNLSHGLVKHPGRYHECGCSPYIGDIVGCEAIRRKLRLNIVDALRAMIDHGPQADEQYVEPAYLLLVGTDPVAVDTCGLFWLNRLRKERGLPPVGGQHQHVAYLHAAEATGVGSANLDRISRQTHIL
ncbi:MAG: DUF362 domain-containing protein [Phycisphaerales bacterium]|nr:MAG: DUF362 domain-containing protein [Phycisphaerales bacterium]